MAVKDVFKINFKTFFNPRAWVGYDLVKDNSQTVFGIFKEVFVQPIPVPEREETFEQAQARYQLTDTALRVREAGYFWMAASFALLAIIVFLVGIILMLDANFAGFIISVSVSLLFFSQAFKYHFWYFQIKHKKLGCTFRDWYNGIF